MIRFEDVTKVYARGARPALDQVSLEVARGEFVFLVGASGSGKSTFLRLALREERPTAGQVYIAGRDLARLSSWKVPTLRRNIGMVFQDFRLLPNKTVYENVAFALEVIGKRRYQVKNTVPELLEMVGLAGTEKRFPHELSGGEQQRVAIARAYVNRPPILLADEPTGNLDPATSEEIMRLLERINRTGTTVMMATHDVGIVDHMRQRVIELADGKVLRDEQTGQYTQSIPVVSLTDPDAALRATASAAVPAVPASVPGRSAVIGRETAKPHPAPPASATPTRAAVRAARTGAIPAVAAPVVSDTVLSSPVALGIAASAPSPFGPPKPDRDEPGGGEPRQAEPALPTDAAEVIQQILQEAGQ